MKLNFEQQRAVDRLNPFSDNGCVRKEYPNDYCSCKKHDPARYIPSDGVLALIAKTQDEKKELIRRKEQEKHIAKEKAKQEFLLALEKIEEKG